MKPSVLWKSDKKLFFGPQGFTRETFGKTLRSFFAGLNLKQTAGFNGLPFLWPFSTVALQIEKKTNNTSALCFHLWYQNIF